MKNFIGLWWGNIENKPQALPGGHLPKEEIPWYLSVFRETSYALPHPLHVVPEGAASLPRHGVELIVTMWPNRNIQSAYLQTQSSVQGTSTEPKQANGRLSFGDLVLLLKQVENHLFLFVYRTMEQVSEAGHIHVPTTLINKKNK